MDVDLEFARLVRARQGNLKGADPDHAVPARPAQIVTADASAGGGGLIIATPLRATVTEAYLLLEGAAIPEPAALALLAAGAAGALLQRRSCLGPLRQAKPADLRRGEGP